MIQSKGMTELVESQTHAVVVIKQEVVLELFDAVPEHQVSVCGIGLMKRHEYIKMVFTFRGVSWHKSA